MNIRLPQSTTDWIFYIINIVTFLLCWISMHYHGDYDGASNELAVVMSYECDRNDNDLKKGHNLFNVFRIARIMTALGLAIAIALITKKLIWFIVLLEIGMIIQTMIILINCLTQADHNFSKYEQYWITCVAAILVMQRLPLGLFSNDILTWQMQLPEGLDVAVQSILWLIQIFMLFIAALLAFNGFCKKKRKINRISYSGLKWNISDWYIKRVYKRKYLICFFPFIILVDSIYFMVRKVLLFLAAMFNELLPSINEAIQRQVDILDTQLIRLAFRGAIVCSLSMMYAYMELKGIHAEATRNIFSYVATVIVTPIVIEGIIGLRDRIRAQARIGERKNSMVDILNEVVQDDMKKGLSQRKEEK